MKSKSVFGDELMIFALTRAYQRHTVVLTSKGCWTTISMDEPISTLWLLKICEVRLLFISPHMYGELKRKAFEPVQKTAVLESLSKILPTPDPTFDDINDAVDLTKKSDELSATSKPIPSPSEGEETQYSSDVTMATDRDSTNKAEAEYLASDIATESQLLQVNPVNTEINCIQGINTNNTPNVSSNNVDTAVHNNEMLEAHESDTASESLLPQTIPVSTDSYCIPVINTVPHMSGNTHVSGVNNDVITNAVSLNNNTTVCNTIDENVLDANSDGETKVVSENVNTSMLSIDNDNSTAMLGTNINGKNVQGVNEQPNQKGEVSAYSDSISNDATKNNDAVNETELGVNNNGAIDIVPKKTDTAMDNIDEENKIAMLGTNIMDEKVLGANDPYKDGQLSGCLEKVQRTEQPLPELLDQLSGLSNPITHDMANQSVIGPEYYMEHSYCSLMPSRASMITANKQPLRDQDTAYDADDADSLLENTRNITEDVNMENTNCVVEHAAHDLLNNDFAEIQIPEIYDRNIVQMELTATDIALGLNPECNTLTDAKEQSSSKNIVTSKSNYDNEMNLSTMSTNIDDMNGINISNVMGTNQIYPTIANANEIINKEEDPDQGINKDTDSNSNSEFVGFTKSDLLSKTHELTNMSDFEEDMTSTENRSSNDSK